MDRKFLYGRGGTTNAHEQAVNTTFNDNPYSIELDRLEALEIKSDNPFMMSVLATKKSLLDEARLVRKILKRDTFYGERSKSPTRSNKSSNRISKNRHTANKDDDDDEDPENEDNVMVVDEELEEDQENKKEKDNDDSSSEEEEAEAEEDLDLDNDYMENHFDNGEGYISDEQT